MTSRQAAGVFFAFYALLLVWIFFTHADYGMSWDEQYYLTVGKIFSDNFFDAYEMASGMTERMPGYMSYAIQGHGPFMDMLTFLPLKIAGWKSDPESLHLVKALLFSGTLIFIFFACRSIHPLPLTGLLGVAFLLFQPRWLGDLFDNQMDMAATLLYGTELLLALKLLSSTQSPARAQTAQCAILAAVSAIAFSHRVILFLVPGLFVPLCIVQFRNEWRRLLKLGVVFTLVFFATLFIVDPYVRLYGVAGIVDRLRHSLSYFWDGHILFEGQYLKPNQLPWYYLPKWMGMTTPLITTVFFLLGTTIFVRRMIKHNSVQETTTSVLLLTSIFLPVLACAFLRPVIYDAWRHFLFLTVPLAIIAGVGAGEGLSSSHRVFRWLTAVLFAANVWFTGYAVSQLYPYHYTYFNSLAGGLRGANSRYETDYWGKSYKEAVVWLIDNEITDSKKTYRIYLCPPPYGKPECATGYFLDNMKLTNNLREADYYLSSTRLDLHRLANKSPVIHIVQRNGAPLNYVIKIRD